MSATKAHHHDRIEAASRTDFDPRKIVDLRQAAVEIVESIRLLQETQLDTYTRYLYGIDTNVPACDYNDHIATLKDRLDLIVAEYLDRRRI